MKKAPRGAFFVAYNLWFEKAVSVFAEFERELFCVQRCDCVSFVYNSVSSHRRNIY